MFTQHRIVPVDVVQRRALGSCPLEPIHPDLARVILRFLVVHLDVVLVRVSWLMRPVAPNHGGSSVLAMPCWLQRHSCRT
eukprot:9535159-Heterocapsa_arctica.AAC.1